MLKWMILTLVGLSFGVAGVGWGFAQQQKAIGFYELRIYTAQPGKSGTEFRRDPVRYQTSS